MANTKQFTEGNDLLKQFMELLNQQNMGEQSQDNQPKSVKENLMDKVAHFQEKITNLSERIAAVKKHLLETAAKEGMSESQPLKTMVHETAHSMLHNKEANKEDILATANVDNGR